jgi:hypothetical protein
MHSSTHHIKLPQIEDDKLLTVATSRATLLSVCWTCPAWKLSAYTVMNPTMTSSQPSSPASADNSWRSPVHGDVVSERD